MLATNTWFQQERRSRRRRKMPGDIGRYQIDYILVRLILQEQHKDCMQLSEGRCRHRSQARRNEDSSKFKENTGSNEAKEMNKEKLKVQRYVFRIDIDEAKF